jgi:hypothetical protein
MRYASLVVLMLGTTGCGSLRVNVSVLDPGVVEREEDRLLIRQRLPIALQEDTLSLRTDVATMQTSHSAARVALSEAYQEEAAAATDPRDKADLTRLATELQTEFAPTFGSRYGALGDELVALNAQIRSLDRRAPEPAGAPGSPLGTRESLLAVLLRQYDGTKARVRNLFFSDTASLSSARRDLDQRASGGAPVTGLVEIERKSDAAALTARSILAGRKLVRDSPYLHAIAAAPDSFWAEKYNDVAGHGRFGNIDVAIKLDESADFSLKGLTFDPSDVARAIAKAGAQTLTLTAQVLGVPVTRTGAAVEGRPGAAFGASSGVLVEAERKAQAAEKTAAELSAALRSIAAAILDTRADWTSATGATREEALAAVRKIYQAQKPLLKARVEESTTTDDEQ